MHHRSTRPTKRRTKPASRGAEVLRGTCRYLVAGSPPPEMACILVRKNPREDCPRNHEARRCRDSGVEALATHVTARSARHARKSGCGTTEHNPRAWPQFHMRGRHYSTTSAGLPLHRQAIGGGFHVDTRYLGEVPMGHTLGFFFFVCFQEKNG
jgi:hypothetical protein